MIAVTTAWVDWIGAGILLIGSTVGLLSGIRRHVVDIEDEGDR